MLCHWDDDDDDDYYIYEGKSKKILVNLPGVLSPCGLQMSAQRDSGIMELNNFVGKWNPLSHSFSPADEKGQELWIWDWRI